MWPDTPASSTENSTQMDRQADSSIPRKTFALPRYKMLRPIKTDPFLTHAKVVDLSKLKAYADDKKKYLNKVCLLNPLPHSHEF